MDEMRNSGGDNVEASLYSTAQGLLRLRIFTALEALLADRGGFLTFQELTQFRIEGVGRPLVGQRGIYNPAYLDHTLSVTSSPSGPYDDKVGPDGLLEYAYEGSNPFGGANRKLRKAMDDQIPIILFERPLQNVWLPIIPAYVVGEDVEKGFFRVAVGEEFRQVRGSGFDSLTRQYRERIVYQRVHQPMFRARVLTAYRRRCAICRLQHLELLDAAHIIPDSDPAGSAAVTNGLSLCKLHHAAYDRNFLGIDPDYRVHINDALLAERDGPMLKHGLQEMHGVELELPRSPRELPDRSNLSQRFEIFLAS